jgi:hypothetical protein
VAFQQPSQSGSVRVKDALHTQSLPSYWTVFGACLQSLSAGTS